MASLRLAPLLSLDQMRLHASEASLSRESGWSSLAPALRLTLIDDAVETTIVKEWTQTWSRGAELVSHHVVAIWTGPHLALFLDGIPLPLRPTHDPDVVEIFRAGHLPELPPR